jgi:cellulose synthase/poly-beta-1,6-N-acetylglucosamine synthase-like glycosyltransferase
MTITAFVLIYTIRHYVFTLNRLFGHQRHPYINIDTASWPTVTVLVAAHNEEAVVAHCMDALLQVSYPSDKLKIMVVNDRSTDQTQKIVDEYAVEYPDRITPFHRRGGTPGKASALKDATKLVESEIIIVFDADYIPGRGLIKQLVAPFFDAEVGLVMGRVVPINTGCNLLTRLLDLERAGGYQVDQQARMNLDLVPQYGGTVGGIRMAALESVGGWIDDTLAEDTDLTYRAILKGWKSVYQNRSECYEEVPEIWPVRIRQISRWTKGHNQVMQRYAILCLFNNNMSRHEKIDALLLLCTYAMSPIIIVGWVLAILLFYMGKNDLSSFSIAVIAITAFGTVGNCAAFFEIGSAAYLDRSSNRIRLLPVNFLNFLVSTVTVSHATFTQILGSKQKNKIWEKTPRFRKENFSVSGS